jgi:hypothetical protein
MLITPLPLNTRHAGPRQVAVGPGALRQLICDTTKVNTGAAETTRTDRDIAVIRQRAGELASVVADPLAPPIRHQREQRELHRLRQIIDSHQETAP